MNKQQLQFNIISAILTRNIILKYENINAVRSNIPYPQCAGIHLMPYSHVLPTTAELDNIYDIDCRRQRICADQIVSFDDRNIYRSLANFFHCSTGLICNNYNSIELKILKVEWHRAPFENLFYLLIRFSVDEEGLSKPLFVSFASLIVHSLKTRIK